MIAKSCKRGTSAKGAIKYITGDNKTDHIALTDTNYKRLDFMSKVRPDIEKPISHFVLSLPENETIDKDKWRCVVDSFLNKMNLKDNEFCAVIHNETNNQHAHILVNRINASGEVWRGEFDGKQSIIAAKQIEKEFDLTIDEHKPTGKRDLTQNEIEKAIRTETQPAKITLQNAIDSASKDNPNLTVFFERLEQQGINIKANVASTGRVSGLSFEYDNEVFKGSELGKKYSWNSIIKEVKYEQERDGSAVQNRSGNRARRADASSEAGGRDSRRADDHRPANGRAGGVAGLEAGRDERGSGAGRSDREGGRPDRSAGGGGGALNEPRGRANTCPDRVQLAELDRTDHQNLCVVGGGQRRLSELTRALLARLDGLKPQSVQQKPERTGHTRTADRSMVGVLER